MSRLAQLVERKTLNLVVVGSSPTVGVPFCLLVPVRWLQLVARHLAVSSLLWRSWQRVGLIILRSRVRSSPGAVRFFIFYTVRVFLCRVVREFSAGFAFGWMAERSKALV